MVSDPEETFNDGILATVELYGNDTVRVPVEPE